MSNLKRVFLVVLVAGLLAPGVVQAQSDEEIYQGFQFNFFAPGARAMAMGGAFIGLADDATAAFSNPAGMVILTKPEVSGEFKFSDYTTMRPARFTSFVTGELTEFGESVASPSFASFVYPVGNISVGVSMSNFINYKEDFYLHHRPIPGTLTAYRGGTGEAEFVGYNFSGSAAVRLSDAFAIGATISYINFNVKTTTTLRSVNWLDFTDLNTAIMNQSVADDSDGGVGFTVGLQITPHEMISIGAVYSYYPKITYAQTMYVLGDANTGIEYSTIEIAMDIPDRFGAGIAIRPLDELVITADVLFVQYSQLTNKIVATYADPGNGISRGDDISNSYETDDATEFHFGIEYALTGGKTPFFLRAGLFTNPSHRTMYKGSDIGEMYRWNLSSYSDDVKDTELGFSFGAGAVLGGAFQLDAAYMLSDSINQAIISVVYHF